MQKKYVVSNICKNLLFWLAAVLHFSFKEKCECVIINFCFCWLGETYDSTDYQSKALGYI